MSQPPFASPPPPPPPHGVYEEGTAADGGVAMSPAARVERRRRRWVPLLITLAVVLFVATESLLYYRWATMNEPTCVLIVDTAPPVRGAEVAVNSPRLHKPYTAIAGEGDRFSLPFYLEPDRYTVTVSFAGSKLFEGQVELTAREPGKKINLTTLAPPPAPATATTSPASAPSPASPASLAP